MFSVRSIHSFLFAVAISGIVACSGGGGSSTPVTNSEPQGPTDPVVPPVEETPSLELAIVDPPFTLPAGLARFAVNIPYDEGDEKVFDIFLPESDSPTPLVIYFHSGGFTGGNKEEVYLASSTLITDILESGAAFASVNYRLLDGNETETEGVIGPLTDSQRALQFMRYYTAALNVDSSRVALVGTSAGAGISLWLAMGDERADATNTDPVLKESTRVTAVAALETQASYDLVRWETDVFPAYGITVAALSQPEYLLDKILQFYAIDAADGMYTVEGDAYRDSVDMLDMMSADDPEFYVKNTFFPLPPSLDDEGALFHHPAHAVALVNQAKAVGLPYVADLLTVPAIGASDEGLTAFILRKLSE